MAGRRSELREAMDEGCRAIDDLVVVDSRILETWNAFGDIAENGNGGLRKTRRDLWWLNVRVDQSNQRDRD